MSMKESVFQAPDHDHGRCAAEALAHAESLCRERGQRLTPIRRQVLEALLSSHKALGAYELIEKTGESGARPAPITIYRALDFLMENGLVHRIESRNAFIGCVHRHEIDELVVFLICDRCGEVGETRSRAVSDSLKAAAREAGFSAKAPLIEIAGLCAHCRNTEKTGALT